MGGLLEALARVPGTVPPELVQRRAALYELLAGKRQRREELQEKAAPDAAAVAALSRDIEMLRVELSTLEAKARGTAGRLPRTEALDPARLLGAVPDTDLVAEYFLGETYGWLFLARAGKVTVHTVPTADAVDESVRRQLERWRKPDGSAGSGAGRGALHELSGAARAGRVSGAHLGRT